MRARAPGKVVISGAYSVIDGGPAIVAAVDRYVLAASDLPANFLTDEVKAAGLSRAYWFDASALRQGGDKLGLGSSAAILAASVAVEELTSCPELSESSLAERVYPRALKAHRVAQGGGSGIDVAAACFGGILDFRLANGVARFARLLPPPLHVEIWASRGSASTARMLAATRRFAEQNPTGYARDIGAQADAAEATSHAWRNRQWPLVIAGLVAQRHALERLGADAGIPIVTPEIRTLADVAEDHDAAVLPAGAGGGDIALYVGLNPPDFMADAIAQCGHTKLTLELGARGVHADNT